MTVSGNSDVLFEFSWYSGPCRSILSTDNISSLFLSLAVGQIQHLPRRPAGLKKNIIHANKYMRRMMIILCQWGFNEQRE
jgi:hypothetical protein